MLKRLKIYQKDLIGSANRGLDWRSEEEENLEAAPIPKSACRLYARAYTLFEYRSLRNFRRTASIETCFFGSFVTRQKNKEIKVRFLSDNSDPEI
jgi:hypothetical protein